MSMNSTFNHEGHTHCTVGAVEQAVIELLRPKKRVSELTRVRDMACYLLTTKLEGRSIPGWNDDPSRTEGDVIELLQQTAKDLRNSVTDVTE